MSQFIDIKKNFLYHIQCLRVKLFAIRMDLVLVMKILAMELQMQVG